MRIAAYALAAALAASGCSTNTQSGFDYSKADPSITKEEANFFSPSGVQACAVGAIIGAAACIAFAGDNRGQCAAYAAAGGCAVGMTANYMLDEVRTQHKQKEDQLNALADYVRKDIARMHNLNEGTKALIERDKKELGQLAADIEAGKKKREDLVSKNEDIDNNIKYLTDSSKQAKENLDNYRKARNEMQTNKDGSDAVLTEQEQKKLEEYNEQIYTLEEQIDELNGYISEYADSKNSLTMETEA